MKRILQTLGKDYVFKAQQHRIKCIIPISKYSMLVVCMINPNNAGEYFDWRYAYNEFGASLLGE